MHNFLFKHKDEIKLNLKGMAIGNGLVDAYLQYPEYDTFAKENGLISTAESVILKGAFAACQVLIKTGLWPISIEACNIAS